MMRLLACALACSALQIGCAVGPTQPQVIVNKPVEAKIEVPVPCLSSLPPTPAFQPERDLLTGSGSQVVDQLWIDHKLSHDYIGTLLAALTACVAPSTASTSKLAGSPLQ